MILVIPRNTQYLVLDTDKTAQNSVFRDSVLAILCNNQYLVHDIGDTAQYSVFGT